VARITLDQGYSVSTMLAVAVAVVVLAALGYRRSFGHLPAKIWKRLLALRAAALLLVVLLLFQPVFRMESEVVQKRGLILALDTSSSMSTADDATGVPRFEQARRKVIEWSSKLSKDFDLRWVAFADRAAAVERPSDLARLNPDGQATSLTRALVAAARVVPSGEEVEGVVVFSDGVHNAAGDPVPTARALGVPVHTVGVGNSLRNSPSYRDVSVAGVECPDQLPVNNQAKIKAQVAQVGLAGRVVKAVLEEDGKNVAQADLELKTGQGPQEVTFDFVPTVKGRHTYNVKVAALPDEKITENNHRSAISQVVDAKIRVLYVEGTLRAEYGALVQRFFSKDPDIEFCALVRTRPGVFVQRTNREGLQLKGIPSDPAVLATFDVVVIGDLDSIEWKAGTAEAMAKRVRDGAGLLMIGGYHSLGPGGYAASPLAELLPLDLGPRDIGQMTEPFLPRLTPAGRGHPIFANIGKFFPSPDAPPQVAGLPPLDGCTKVKAAKPGATVLALGPGTAGGSEMPVMAVQPLGKGRSAAFTGDTTRNWQQAPRAMDRESPFLRFWGQSVRWLANRSGGVNAEAGVVARTDKAYYEPDVPIGVLAVVRDKDGEGTDKAEVRAQVRGPKGEAESLPLSAVAGSSGSYRGDYEPKVSGTYEIVVEAKLGNAQLKAEKVVTDVGRANLEFDRLDLDEKMLTRISESSGGRYRHISTADHLLDELDRKAQRRRVALEQPMSWPAPFWVAFVGLLAAEWVIRKRCQLR
jgi:uncharacterized membrane protein